MDLKNFFKREMVYIRDLEILFFVSNNTASLKMQVFHQELGNADADCILASDLAKVTNLTEQYIIDKLHEIDEAKKKWKEQRKLERENKKKEEEKQKEMEKLKRKEMENKKRKRHTPKKKKK